MAGPVIIEWSPDALADLDRFAAFLHDRHPELAGVVAQHIVRKVQILSTYPRLGRPIAGRPEYRQLVLRVLNAPYVFQYRYGDDRLVVLRVFHSREDRS